MTVTSILRQPRANTYLAMNGLPIDVPFFNARCSEGFDQAVSQAEFTVPYLTARLAINTPINLFIDADEIGQPSQIQCSFSGFIVGYQVSLYPRGVTVMCEGPLTKAAHYKPDNDTDYAGVTDVVAIRLVLVASGIPLTQMFIQGTGDVLGQNVAGSTDERFVHRKGQSALDFIQSLDQISLGYRTFEGTGSGFVVRKLITGLPMAVVNTHFGEGEDITLGNSDWQLEDGAVGVEVMGANGPIGSQIIAGQSRTGLGTGFVRLQSDKIETQAQADAVAAWAAVELGRPVARVTLTTYRRDTIRSGQTVEVEALSRLGLNRKVWVQNVVRELQESGQFSQTLGLISEMVPDPTIVADHPPGEETTFGGDIQPATADTIATPALADPLADFTFEFIDHEFTDAAVEFWIVVVRSSSYPVTGTIATYAWTTDTTTIPDTGSDPLFTFKTDDIATEITLTVTDSEGNSAAVTKPCDSPDALNVTRDRHLYAASGSTDAIAYDGNGNWNTQAVTCDVVGNGPIWNSGSSGSIALSQDDLATAPGFAAALSGEKVTAVWCETDLNASQVYAGGASGGVARSIDGGDTWTALTSASAEPVLRIIASRYNPGEVLILDDAGDVFQSLDGGISWGLIASHPGAVDLAQSNFRNWVGGSFGVAIMESGVLATWPGATPNILAITAHIREDRIYALADDGSTFYTDPEGGLGMVAGASIPSGTAVARCMMRDGGGVDLIYIAATDRILKSHDGLRTTAGYTVIYTGAAVQVGYGDFPLTGSGGPPAAVGELWLVDTEGLVYFYDPAGPTITETATQGAQLQLFGMDSRIGLLPYADDNQIVGSSSASSQFREATANGGGSWTDNAWTGPGGGLVIPDSSQMIIRKASGNWYAANIMAVNSGSQSVANNSRGVWESTNGYTWTFPSNGTLDTASAGNVGICRKAGVSENHIFQFRREGNSTAIKLYDEALNVLSIPSALAWNTPDVLNGGFSIYEGGIFPCSHAGDVGIVSLMDGSGNWMLWKITPSGATDVTPSTYSGFAAADDVRMWGASPDGVSWVLHVINVTSGDDYLLQSTDSGATWAEVLTQAGSQFSTMGMMAFDPASPTVWYCNWNNSGSGQTDWQLLASTDNGATWAVISGTAAGPPGGFFPFWAAAIPYGVYD